MPTESFVNDRKTNVTVRVIAPNDPHYQEYVDYLAGRSVSVMGVDGGKVDWSQYGTPVSLEAGEPLYMFDENNSVEVDVDLSGDSDGDGLDNEVEMMQTGTDFQNADTDGDGLNDYAEIMGSSIDLLFPSGTVHTNCQTCATWGDTDDDGISDGDEIKGLHAYECNGVTSHYVTNPCAYDTDGDGIPDGLDRHPLVSCRRPDATAIDEDWAWYWEKVAKEAGVAAVNLRKPGYDSDGDGKNNLSEMKDGTCPVFADGFRRAVFVPNELEVAIEGTNVVEKTFVMRLFSGQQIMCGIHMSKEDWQPTLTQSGLSTYWSKCPLSFDKEAIIMVRCPYYKEVKMKLALDPSKMNQGVKEQYVGVVGDKGEFSETLPVTLNGGTGKSAPTRPVLLQPAEGSDVRLTYPLVTDDSDYEKVNFSWGASVDPEGSSISYELRIYDDVGILLLACPCPDTSVSIQARNWDGDENDEMAKKCLLFERGYYYWKVIAKNEDGLERSSLLGSFFISIPGDEDGDGVEDDEEIKKGSNPFDKESLPFELSCDASLPEAEAGREYYTRLLAKGTCGYCVSWACLTPQSLPEGITVTSEGEVRGKPVKEGLYKFSIYAKCQDRTFMQDVTLWVVKPKEGIILKTGIAK